MYEHWILTVRKILSTTCTSVVCPTFVFWSLYQKRQIYIATIKHLLKCVIACLRNRVVHFVDSINRVHNELSVVAKQDRTNMSNEGDSSAVTRGTNDGDADGSSATSKAGLKSYSLSEVAEHNHQGSLWVVIKNNVYDLSQFIDEHPGGEEVLLEQAGKEATDAFEDVGHSTDARELMKDYKIGEITEADKKALEEKNRATWEVENSSNSSWMSWLIPVGIAVAATILYRFYLASSSAATSQHNQ